MAVIQPRHPVLSALTPAYSAAASLPRRLFACLPFHAASSTSATRRAASAACGAVAPRRKNLSSTISELPAGGSAMRRRWRASPPSPFRPHTKTCGSAPALAVTSQATGRDARGRKQYRYHAEWSRARDDHKHSRMQSFGKSLVRLRTAVRRDLRLTRPAARKGARAGGAAPRCDTGARRQRRVRAQQRQLRPDYPARSPCEVPGTRQGAAAVSAARAAPSTTCSSRIARLAKLVRRCQELPGQALFQYLDDDGKRRAVDSGQVNDYLRERMGGEFSAKDFRTWHATLHALTLLAGDCPCPRSRSEAALRRCMNAVIKEVAAGLRNTPAVCRKSYINPAVFSAWQIRQPAAAGRARRCPRVAVAAPPIGFLKPLRIS